MLRLHAPGDLRLHDEPVPVPRETEQLAHVEAVGICGSDLHWFSEAAIGDAQLEHQLVLGHEFVRSIVTHRFPLAERREGLKIIIEV